MIFIDNGQVLCSKLHCQKVLYYNSFPKALPSAPREEGKWSSLIALICDANRRMPASASTNQGSAKKLF
jgi:hypothetical protein